MSSSIVLQKERRRVTVPRLLFFFGLLMLLTGVLLWSEATKKLDQMLHDIWVRTNPPAVPQDVVIASIDEASLRELGRWPWSRNQLTTLMEKLLEYDARAVVIDIVLTEPAAQEAEDQGLANAIAALPVAVLPVHTGGTVPGKAIELMPVPAITRIVDHLGHVDYPVDDDGIVRRVYLRSGVRQAHWSSLSLAALEALELAPEPLPGRKLNINADSAWVEDNEVLIPFYGPSGTFKRISAVDIILDEISDDALIDKVVFVGMTSEGLEDVLTTPVSAKELPMPGVEVHANVFSALRDDLMVDELDPRLNYLIAFVLLGFTVFLYSRAPLDLAFVNMVAASLVPIIISYLLYRFAQLWLAPLVSSVPVLISYFFWSRHRLAYINSFLRREHAKSHLDSSTRQAGDDEALVEFFESAHRHLPIRAWRFSTDMNHYVGGSGLPERRVAGGDDAWALSDNVFARRYKGKPPLHIEFSIEDTAQGVEIAELIDSLARIRAREQASLFSDSIEQLQTNAMKLSSQLDWLRGVKATSDSILSGSPAGFVVWNAAGECMRANELTYELIPDFSHRGQLLEFVKCIGRDDKSKKDTRRLHELLHESKEWQVTSSSDNRELIINFRAVGDNLSERLICASIIDVTDIRTSERARAEMVDYLSHDLRSPLISALYLLDQEHDPRIERNINSSLAMMDNLLHVARADSLSEAQFQPLLLNAVLDNSLDQLLPQALSRQIQFDIDTDDDDLWVNGDAASLERAFTNIVGNAIKYSPEQTTVTVRLRRQDRSGILTVDDQGVGIAPEMLGKLFNRFKRDKNTSGEFKGIGLGLALVSRVVSLHNGTVEASNNSVGTRITLQLPLEQHAMDLIA